MTHPEFAEMFDQPGENGCQRFVKVPTKKCTRVATWSVQFGDLPPDTYCDQHERDMRDLRHMFGSDPKVTRLS